MFDQVTLQTALMVFQTISILVGVIYYVTTMRNQNRTRQVQIINSADIPKDWSFLTWDFDGYDDFMSKYGPDVNPDALRLLMTWFGVLEAWGVYVREGLLDVRFVCLMIGGAVKESWEKYEPIWVEWRVRLNRPRDMVEAEYLYNQVIDYFSKHPELDN